MKFIAWLLFWFFYSTIAYKRRPDQIIGRGDWYMLRWWVLGETTDEKGKRIPRRAFGRTFYLHCFLHPDSDVPHDHPWDWWSLILHGGPYIEHRREIPYPNAEGKPDYEWHGAVEVEAHTHWESDTGKYYGLVARTYKPGCFVHGRATDAHRVDLGKSDVLIPRAIYDMPWMSNAEVQKVLNGRYAPVWTFFGAGTWQRDWGFHCPRGWVFWRDFTDESGDGVDRGCGEKA